MLKRLNALQHALDNAIAGDSLLAHALLRQQYKTNKLILCMNQALVINGIPDSRVSHSHAITSRMVKAVSLPAPTI